ncbi:ATP-binding cassette domain-containing protein [Nocardiopsis sp. ARC36]
MLGANGVGKTTLLRCLAGLQRASGSVSVLGRPPVDEPGFWREVALVGDEPTWYPGLTVREHLELMRGVHGPGRLEVGPALDLFELGGCADRAPSSLSTGQRQRLSLAMALLRPSGCCCCSTRPSGNGSRGCSATPTSAGSTRPSGNGSRGCSASTPTTAGRWSW